jgi:hypothetical protein
METMLKRSAGLALLALVLSAGFGIALHAAGAATVTPAACVAKEPSTVPANSWAPARTQLAPPGAVTIRLCRYDGLNTKPALALAAQALVTRAATVEQLSGELEALKAPSGLAFCPMDDGGAVDMLLAYSGGHSVLVQVELSGCTIANNGNVSRTAATTKAGSELLRQIAQLTGYKGSVF